MSRYNLIDEAWMPLRTLGGKRVEWGLRDTLLRAAEIAVIEDPSPLVVASLHRFLLAVLYRALEGPADIDQANAWFRNGIPSEQVDAYLERWRERFWLFDEQYAFFQTPVFTPKKEWRAWTALAAEHNADNAKVLFDHINVNDAGAITEASAARWLIAAQTFALGGGNSELGYTSSAPSASAVMAIPTGRNLGDTLLLNLVPQNREVLGTDLPAWEREPEATERLKTGITREVAGHAQLYTWPSRTIRLRDTTPGSVSQLAFAAGVKFGEQAFVDPMLAYRIDDKRGKLPRQFSERGLWRDFDSLLPDDTHLAPGVIEHAARLARPQRDRFPASVMVLGQSTSKAKIEYWRLELFVLPPAIATDNTTRSEIGQALQEAEGASKSMEMALRDWAWLTIAKGERDLQLDKWAKGKWKPGDVSKAIGKMQQDAEPSGLVGFWSSMEAAFHDLLRSYTLERDPDDIRRDWLRTVRSALREAWAQHSATVSTGDAWAIRALVKAEGAINRKLGELNEEIRKYETHRIALEKTT